MQPMFGACGGYDGRKDIREYKSNSGGLGTARLVPPHVDEWKLTERQAA